MPCICLHSRFICSLFPENLNTDKKGRPTTASTKIKVGIETEALLLLSLFDFAEQELLFPTETS